MNHETLTQKKRKLDEHRPLPKALIRNLEDWFRVELTYTSNAIEGNTLTRRETAVVIEKGLTVGGKSLTEHLEATNHAKALDFIYSLIHKPLPDLSQHDILHIHEIILKTIDDENAGRYRSIPVRISGSAVVLPNPRKVPVLMDAFHEFLTSSPDLHPVALAAEAHYRLVTIPPFVDGNGRTARLLMNLVLMMHGYPPAIIRKHDRLSYIGALEKAQLGGPKEPYEKLIAKAADRSLDIYLRAASGETPDEEPDTESLLKIGALAKLAGVSVSTVRHWTSEGLLSAAEHSASGYQLFSRSMIDRCKNIQTLKQKRHSLSEIRELLDKE